MILINDDLVIRDYVAADCQTLSAIIRENLIHINSRDYCEEIIHNMYRTFTPDHISNLSKIREIYVAVKDTIIVGTASLDKDTIYTLFIDINHHNKGIGREFIHFIERIAVDSGVTTVKLPSSITAQGFYEKLGYEAIDIVDSAEYGRDIIMIKILV
ncbi:GNAT family N-acetyltransferase [Paenibacillus sp. 19GGS1-52]|uniref:GNAT family N-acetyltransferase n=1 Tax=Paenibacillus sp. 19GGS1-52 TaxID=2758563 RepID=UPI0023BAEE1A|nr:GNAT family N-acetyltransferase [Paenibacillus sp. 19GGS1-52]